jgi:hypothetical protein
MRKPAAAEARGKKRLAPRGEEGRRGIKHGAWLPPGRPAARPRLRSRVSGRGRPPARGLADPQPGECTPARGLRVLATRSLRPSAAVPFKLQGAQGNLRRRGAGRPHACPDPRQALPGKGASDAPQGGGRRPRPGPRRPQALGSPAVKCPAPSRGLNPRPEAAPLIRACEDVYGALPRLSPREGNPKGSAAFGKRPPRPFPEAGLVPESPSQARGRPGAPRQVPARRPSPEALTAAGAL